MRTHSAGATVKKGYYLNLKSFELLTIDQEGGVLAGAVGSRYVKLPWPLLLVFAPAVGAAFVFFLPAIAFAMVLYYFAKVAYKLVAKGVQALVPVGVSSLARGEAALPTAGDLGRHEKDVTDRRSGDGRGE
jgi:hypothetical protein